MCLNQSINDHRAPQLVSQFSRITAHVGNHEWKFKNRDPQSVAEYEGERRWQDMGIIRAVTRRDAAGVPGGSRHLVLVMHRGRCVGGTAAAELN